MDFELDLIMPLDLVGFELNLDWICIELDWNENEWNRLWFLHWTGLARKGIDMT